MDKDIQPVPFIYDQASIVLPLDEDTFKDFLVSLLGQPETIEGQMKGSFEINIGDFQKIDQLLDNRIETQNLSSLLEFKAKLFFDDDTSMSFNGVESFVSYNEIRPLICTGFIFTWSYLVKFHNKQASEKQEISISSVASKESSVVFLSDFKDVQTNKIIYSVRCTNKSWGIEIAELIRKTLLMLFKSNNSLYFIRRKSSQSTIFFVFVTACILICFSYIFRKGIIILGIESCSSLMDQAKSYIEKDVKLEQKINLILQLSSKCNGSIGFGDGSTIYVILLVVFVFLSVALSFALALKIVELIQPPDYHFILFTEKSRKVRKEYFRKLKGWRIFWAVTISLGLILGITSGVIGNYIYSFLTR
jgi:hypothetical protein